MHEFDERRSSPAVEAIPAWPWPMLVLDPQAAGALLSGDIPRRSTPPQGATAPLDDAFVLGGGRIPLLRSPARAVLLRLRYPIEQRHHLEGLAAITDSWQSGRSVAPRISRSRRAGQRGDCSHRGPRVERAPLRTGHPLGPRQRLHSQRGDRIRTRRALLRGARLRRDRARLSAERPLLLSALGRRRQGTATR